MKIEKNRNAVKEFNINNNQNTINQLKLEIDQLTEINNINKNKNRIFIQTRLQIKLEKEKEKEEQRQKKGITETDDQIEHDMEDILEYEDDKFELISKMYETLFGCRDLSFLDPGKCYDIGVLDCVVSLYLVWLN